MSKFSKWKKIIKDSGITRKVSGLSNRFSKLFLENPDLEKFCKTAIKKYPQFGLRANVIKILFLGVKKRKCLYCKNYLSYEKLKKSTIKYCCAECRNADAANIQKRKQEAIFKKYGVDNISKLESIKEKKRQTTFKHFGVLNPGESEEIKEKMRQTCIKNHGVPIYSMCEKSKKAQSLRWKEASEEQRNEWISKQQESMWGNMREEMKRRLALCHLEFVNENDYHGFKTHKTHVGIRYKFRCKNCGTEFEAIFRPEVDMREWCPTCNKGGISYYFEKQILDYIIELLQKEDSEFFKSSNRTYLAKDRIIISPFELDFVIPSKHIAFECDGMHWHSEQNGKDKKYHLFKTEECEKKGYQLIHIFEDEWYEKKQIVKNRIKHLLGFVKNKIYGRNCVVKPIGKQLSSKFIEKYHIQGDGVDSIRYGLFYRNHLVAVMTFGKSRFNKNYEWEMIRYCSVANFNVIGGAGKLLSYFKKNNKGSIITYADRRWSNGNLYKKLGFEELSPSAPSYFYIKGYNRYNRQQFMKHKLKDKLKKYDPNKTELENMISNGYERIWDCGNKVFVMKND